MLYWYIIYYPPKKILDTDTFTTTFTESIPFLVAIFDTENMASIGKSGGAFIQFKHYEHKAMRDDKDFF